MALVEAINCPKCGAPLEIEKGDPITVCIYCESRVRVVFDSAARASGQLAQGALTPEEVYLINAGLDRQLVRLRQQRKELEGKLETLRQLNRVELEKAQAQYKPSNSGVVTGGAVLALGIVMTIGGLAGGKSTVFIGVLGFMLAAVGLWLVLIAVFKYGGRADEQKRLASRVYEDRLIQESAPISEQINVLQHKIDLTARQIEKAVQR